MIESIISGLDGLAGIRYLGEAGVSAPCLAAVQQTIQLGLPIRQVWVVSHQQRHGLLITLADEQVLGVKVGFTSGYAGEGPATFAAALHLLDTVGCEVEEYEVSGGFLARLDASALKRKDLDQLAAAKPVRPYRLGDYAYTSRTSVGPRYSSLTCFPPVIPWAIIDERLADLALRFFDDPDKALLDAFRRLEEGIRRRTGLSEHGSKLFSQAFAAEAGPLCWGDLDKGEHTGRLQLFTGAYQAFRNPRAHRPSAAIATECLAEFLVVNQLFRLESAASLRSSSPAAETSSARSTS